MADVNFKIVGLNRIQRKFAAIGKSFEPAIEQVAVVVRKKLKDKRYAPKRPGQRYVRTGLLGRSWSGVERLRKLTYRIRNYARSPKGTFYTSFVIGERQTWVHRGRWWTAERVAFHRIVLILAGPIG